MTVALDPRDDVLSRLPAPVKRMLRYFLPAGFPASVTPDYIHYVKWLFLENTLSSMLYVLSMTAMMASVNVASSSVGIAAVPLTNPSETFSTCVHVSPPLCPIYRNPILTLAVSLHVSVSHCGARACRGC